MTTTFSSGTRRCVTISFFEHSEDVMMVREKRAQPFNKMRCIALTGAECDGMVKGVTSWIVQTTGIGPMGNVAAVGINITSAHARDADTPAPPKRHKRS